MDSISALWYCLPPAAILTQSYLIVSSVFICIQPKLNLYSLKFFQLPLFPIFHNYEVFHNLWGLDSCKFPISLIFYKTDLMQNSIRPGECHKSYQNHKIHQNSESSEKALFIYIIEGFLSNDPINSMIFCCVRLIFSLQFSFEQYFSI